MNSIQEQLKKNNIILAPLAGVSSFPFRMFNRKFGCKFAFMEMINVRSLCYFNKRTPKILHTNSNDRPLGIQLLGQDPYYIEKGFEKLENYKYDVLDFNAGCPQKKITNRNEGASLLKDPHKLHQLLSLLVKMSDVPVTLKMRLGWDSPSAASDIALHAQDAGIDALCVHGRTKMQGYNGGVDYKAIRKVKEALEIPVLASGDIFTPQLAKKMFDETGCDGIMVARGSLGNPWIFKQIKEYLKDGTLLPNPKVVEIINIMKMHLDLCIDFFQEEIGIKQFRKFYIWYTHGFPYIRHLRTQVMKVKREDEMISLIEKIGIQDPGDTSSYD